MSLAARIIGIEKRLSIGMLYTDWNRSGLWFCMHDLLHKLVLSSDHPHKDWDPYPKEKLQFNPAPHLYIRGTRIDIQFTLIWETFATSGTLICEFQPSSISLRPIVELGSSCLTLPCSFSRDWTCLHNDWTFRSSGDTCKQSKSASSCWF